MADEKPTAVVKVPAHFTSEVDLKKVLAGEYMKQIQNYFGDQKLALRFLSSVTASVQRLPDLLECTPVSVLNSFMTMAQLQLMPSGVSGEAYVLPYWNKKKFIENDKEVWRDVREAQFQLGYQGLVTLFYRAGIRKVVGELVRKNDKFEYVNGVVTHTVDPFSERGERIGAYVIVTLPSGEEVHKVMSKKEILEIAQRFSKSYASKKKTPWDEDQDPQGWMWIKTVLKQIAKLIPKNDALNRAIAEDNRDSVIGDRLPEAKALSSGLKMGALIKQPTDNHDADNHDQHEGGEDLPTIEIATDEDGQEIGKDIAIE